MFILRSALTRKPFDVPAAKPVAQDLDRNTAICRVQKNGSSFSIPLDVLPVEVKKYVFGGESLKCFEICLKCFFPRAPKKYLSG